MLRSHTRREPDFLAERKPFLPIQIVATLNDKASSWVVTNKPDIHPLSFLSALGLAALITTTPFVIYEAKNNLLIWPDITGWGVILYAAIFPSILSQLFWVLSLEKIGSNRGGIFINLVPIFGAILAILLLGEQFQAYHAIGMVLVLGGIAYAQKNSAQ